MSESYNNTNATENTGKIKIYMEQWRDMHPFPDTIYRSDKYYLDIAQKIADILVDCGFEDLFSSDYIKNVSLSLAAYFEDVISELGLFRAFITRYRQVFQRDFPWYKIEEEYFDDEVNYVDVRFVLWMAMYVNSQEKIPNPENPGVGQVAHYIFDLMLDEFENAPVNHRLVDQIYNKKVLEDPGLLKAIFMWMSSGCYLTPIVASCKEVLQRDLDQLHDLFEPVKSNAELVKYLDSSYSAFKQRRGPLALYPKEWYVLMRQTKGLTEGNEEILKIDISGVYPFVIVKNNGKTITMRTCHGLEFEVNKNSFTKIENKENRVGDMVLTMLFSYKGLWNICGVALTQPYHDTNLSLEKLSEIEPEFIDANGNYVDMLTNVDEHIPGNSPLGPTFDPERCDKQIKENKGDRMFYFKDIAQTDKWVKKNLQTKEEEVPERRNIDSNPIALYINDDYQLLMSEIARMVHDPSNPYYKSKYDTEMLGYITDLDVIANQMVSYMLDHNYLDRLSLNSVYGQENGHRLLQENLRFFLTFSRAYPFYNQENK